jgi:hypothetical protein
MKATIDFDEQLYRRLKVEAARRGRTVRELVAEGVRRVLDAPADSVAADRQAGATWRPTWLGALERQARAVDDHTMDAVRASIARRRADASHAPSPEGKRPGTRTAKRRS